MSVFSWVKGKLKIESGAGLAGIADVTAASELKTLDPQVLAAINTLAGLVATQATLAALKTRADLLGTEATLATRATEATAGNILTRANLLGTEATLTAFKNAAATELTLAALKARADLLGTEATLAALKARADLLASEATLGTLVTRANLLGTEATLAALKSRADLLGTEVTLGNLLTRANLLATEVTAAAIKTVLDTIFTRLGDGNQFAKIGQAQTTTPALAADNAVGYLATDAYKQVRVISDNSRTLPPWQTSVRKVGSISTNQTTVVQITNATGVPTNAPPQDTAYTVPVGRVFCLRKFRVTQLTKAGADGVVGAIKVGGVIDIVASTTQGGSLELTYESGVEFPAGSVLTIWAGVTGGTIVGSVEYEGVERPA